MENPRLPFLSPTLVVGDKSLTVTVAHEIAHSWFGNLVTNASWSMFFLNEGFTMYAQRRITDMVHGEAYTALEYLVSWRLLEQEIKDQGGGGPFTRLLCPIPDDTDPDDTYNDVPYEKGCAFLYFIREVVLDGDVAALDGWLRQYVSDFQFSCVGASEMIAHLRAHFAGRASDPLNPVTGKLNLTVLTDWLEGEGMPPDGYTPDFSAAKALSDPAEELHRLAVERDVPPPETSATAEGVLGSELYSRCVAFRSWGSFQKSYALDACTEGPPFKGGVATLLAFGKACGLHDPPSKNCELSMRWSVLLCKEGVTGHLADIDAHLTATGKQKFTLPVYRALAKAQPRHLFDEAAQTILAKCRPFLDGGVLRKVEGILATPVTEAQECEPIEADEPLGGGVKGKRFVFASGWGALTRGKCAGCPKC